MGCVHARGQDTWKSQIWETPRVLCNLGELLLLMQAFDVRLHSDCDVLSKLGHHRKFALSTGHIVPVLLSLAIEVETRRRSLSMSNPQFAALIIITLHLKSCDLFEDGPFRGAGELEMNSAPRVLFCIHAYL